jgi:hypothetical protein
MTSLPPATDPEDDNDADTALPADSAAVLRGAVEADEAEDLREGEGKDEHP